MRCAWPLPLSVLVLLAPRMAAGAAAGATSSAPAPAVAPAANADREARRAAMTELSTLAARIEALKKDVAAGRARPAALEPLLARAQELAAFLEHAAAGGEPKPPRSPGPDPEELRERADALRDRADRLGAALSQIDRRIGEARRRDELEDRLQRLGGAGDLFAESSPRRVQSGGRSVVSGAPGAAPGGAAPTTASPSSAPSTPPAQPVAPAPSTANPAPDSAARAITATPSRDPDALLPGEADSIAQLQRKRAGVQGELATLRAQAEALEAEARRAEAAR